MKVRKKRPNLRILLVGCGKMGRALGSGWLSSGLDPEKLMAVEPDPSEASEAKSKGIITVPSASEALDNFDPEWIIFCVKPNILNEVAKSYQHLSAKVHYLSIAAGKTLLQLTEVLGEKSRIVRGMPNTPASVCEGITALVTDIRVSPSARDDCSIMMESIGEVVWIEDESLMDSVTAISGSGPAYVFLLIECLSKAGREVGLSEEISSKLARATITGAGSLIRQSDLTATELRANVTSPNGTTAAAMDVLLKSNTGLQEVISKAVIAARNRSKKLSN